MLNDFTGADRVYIACGYTDLRKGIDGLAALVQQQFELDPFTNTLFLDFGNQIKARAAAEQTFLIQLANGAEGYLPTAKAEEHGHYSAFISSGQVGHIGGEQLVRETLQNIRQMFAE